MGYVELVALDSQCYTYLITALTELISPLERNTDEGLANEHKALVRLFFYMPSPLCFALPPSVKAEYENITDPHILASHRSWNSSIFNDIQITDTTYVSERTESFSKQHNRKENDYLDCKILSECDASGTKTLLSHDKKFIEDLSCASDQTAIIRPTLFWAHLNIPKGSPPRQRPRYDNPLSAETWWVW